MVDCVDMWRVPQLLRNARLGLERWPLGATSVREKERHEKGSIASCCNTHHP